MTGDSRDNMENNIWDTPTAQRAVEAYQARWTSTNSVRNAKLHQEVSKILGVSVPFPTSNEIVVDGITFRYINSSDKTNSEPVLRVQIGNYVADNVRTLSDLGGFIVNYDEVERSLLDPPSTIGA